MNGSAKEKKWHQDDRITDLISRRHSETVYPEFSSWKDMVQALATSPKNIKWQDINYSTQDFTRTFNTTSIYVTKADRVYEHSIIQLIVSL